LVVDCYGPFLVVQFLTLGVERRREEILDALEEVLQPAGIYERSDVEVRGKEGLPLRTGLARGEMPPAELEVRENRWRFIVDVQHGQKTGFYLDQRVNRERVGRYAGGAEVLNCFSYTGGFGVYAAAGGARRIVNIDSSASALEWCARHLERNGFGDVPAEQVEGDVFQVLRRYRQEGRQFDLIILDPPKFATTQANVMAAARGYKDINLVAIQLLRPGGILATFSCSGLISADLFQKIVFGASADARRPVQILEYLAQSPDHPVLLSFPESAYLKGLICRVLT
jgi:23S rRNA (cytosine1962-C5)-methyltransferase